MKLKRRLIVLLTAAVLLLSLTGCKETLTNMARKVLGTADTVQEEDTTRWAESTEEPLIVQGITDPSAKYEEAKVDGCLSAVFNGIWNRQTSYFTYRTAP